MCSICYLGMDVNIIRLTPSCSHETSRDGLKITNLEPLSVFHVNLIELEKILKLNCLINTNLHHCAKKDIKKPLKQKM